MKRGFPKIYDKTSIIVFVSVFLGTFLLMLLSESSIIGNLTIGLVNATIWLVIGFGSRIISLQLKRKWKYDVPTFIIVIVLGVLFFVAISYIGTPDTTTNDLVQKDIILEELTAEEVLDKYLSYFDYKGISDRLNKLRAEKQLASGVMLKSLELNEYYFTQRQLLNSERSTICNQIESLVNQNLCNITQEIYVLNNMERQFEVLSKTIVEESEDIVKIEVESKTIWDDTFQKTETIEKSTYILTKEEGVWKLSDFIDASGKLFSEIEELDKRKSDQEISFNEQRERYQKFKQVVDEAVEEQQQLNLFLDKGVSAIDDVIPSERVISIDLGKYDDQDYKYVISITYYFKDLFLSDNYLQVMYDASDIFKEVFPINSQIYQVQTTVKETYTDNYGNVQERYLARTSMDRTTYNKINWKGFESSNLNTIANVDFYGDSFYKSLKELGSRSTVWQTIPSGSFPMIDGLPLNFCDEANEQCRTYGDCDTYEMLKSQGVC